VRRGGTTADFPQARTALAADGEARAVTETSGMPLNVLIVGSGPAALEAALALHRLAGDRVSVTLLAPDAQLTYRPLSVLAPFGAGGAPTYPLERMAADAGFTQVRDRLASVDPIAHRVTTVTGEQLGYDVVLVASGARPTEPFPAATAFTGSLTDQERLHGIVQDIEGGYLHRIAFVVPDGATWPLPLYELALMLAERAYQMGNDVQLHLVTPEAAPLELFGAEAAQAVRRLLEEAKIALHTNAATQITGRGQLRVAPTADTLEVDRIVSLPRLKGPAIAGLPADGDGFLATDDHGRVLGVPDVYAAGDVTAFPIKQGGLACQQADAAAADIARRAGAPVQPEPFTPVLRGLLLTERQALHMRDGEVAGRALWWPPTKIAGRELAGYLEGLDETAGRPAGRVVNLAFGHTGPGEIEVLSLH
jgi:sulfide:quinone oxidoreductase